MANFLPEEFRSELEGLQDQVPPRPFEEIAEKIQSELGGKVDDLFASFNHTCIASASLGQVHEAKTKEGLRVAVKVQHKDIDEMVKLDLVTIRRIMMIVQWFVPVQGLDAYYHQIKSLLYEELDFAREADNIERISKNFKSSDNVIFPTPVRELSTHRVITTTFVDGKKIGDLHGIDELGIDKKDLASRLVRAYCQMIFVDGIYHADPHPGNVLVRNDGALILLDFGAIAELSPQMRDGIPEFLEGVLRRDTDRLIKALRKMGFLARNADDQVSEKIIEYFHRKFQDEVKIESFNLKDIKIDPQRGFENLLDLRKMNIGMKELSSSFLIPKDWVLLERTIILLYGCCSMLEPDLNPMAIIQPYLQDFVFGNRDWQQIALETVREMAMSAVTLPEDLKKYLVRATRGEARSESERRARGRADDLRGGSSADVHGDWRRLRLGGARAPLSQRRRRRAVAARRRDLLRFSLARVVDFFAAEAQLRLRAPVHAHVDARVEQVTAGFANEHIAKSIGAQRGERDVQTILRARLCEFFSRPSRRNELRDRDRRARRGEPLSHEDFDEPAMHRAPLEVDAFARRQLQPLRVLGNDERALELALRR